MEEKLLAARKQREKRGAKEEDTLGHTLSNLPASPDQAQLSYRALRV